MCICVCTCLDELQRGASLHSHRYSHTHTHTKQILHPGETAPVHTHEYPYTFIVENGSTIEVRGAEGEYLMTFTAEKDEALSFDLIGG